MLESNKIRWTSKIIIKEKQNKYVGNGTGFTVTGVMYTSNRLTYDNECVEKSSLFLVHSHFHENKMWAKYSFPGF